jgi:hypothetical protein
MHPTFPVALCLSLALAAGSAAAKPDPFPTPADAAGHGYNTTRHFVSASYNKAQCKRDRASRYESVLVDILPTYMADLGTSPEKLEWAFQGSYHGWLETILDEYSDCAGVDGFAAVPVQHVADIAAQMLIAFAYAAPQQVSANTIYLAFDYDPGLVVSGTESQCVDRINSVMPPELADLGSLLSEVVCGPLFGASGS